MLRLLPRVLCSPVAEGWGSSWKDGGRDKKGEGSQWWKKDDDPWDEGPNDMSGIDVRKCKKCKHNWSYVREGGCLNTKCNMSASRFQEALLHSRRVSFKLSLAVFGRFSCIGGSPR